MVRQERECTFVLSECLVSGRASFGREILVYFRQILRKRILVDRAEWLLGIEQLLLVEGGEHVSDG